MQLRAVDGYALSSPIDPPQDRRFATGTRRLLKRDCVLVIVETAAGARGVAPAGASSSAMREYFADASQHTFADVIDGPVADALEGESVETVATIHERIREAGLTSRLESEAIAALDIAWHDLRGKELGAPVYALLAEDYGTEPTTELPLYASAGMYMEPEGYVSQASRLEELGFFGYKYRPGIGPDADRRTVDRLLEATADIAIMLDAHTWWKQTDLYTDAVVADLVDHATEQGAFWIEEPVAPDDYDGYRDLATTGAPLAGGESEESAAGLLALAETGAVSFLQGDVRHHEGFTGCRDAIEYCRGRSIEFVPHNFGTWLGLMANAHLVAAAPDVRLLEYPVFEGDPTLGGEPDPGMYPYELAFDIIEEEPAIENGRLTLADEPGLGVTVDPDVIEDYPFIEGPWTEFRYDDSPAG
ncbi:MAG: mandelate racemase/muconate lactonizing enzyme family protein [Halobacteriales archaeon]